MCNNNPVHYAGARLLKTVGVLLTVLLLFQLLFAKWPALTALIKQIKTHG